MPFRFIHTADWQIGRAFAKLPADRAVLLREARLDAIDRIATAARTAGAAHVLVAGDVFDDELPAIKTMRQLRERIRAQGGLTWHLISGNHDPHKAGGAWEQMAYEGVPENLRLHLTPTACEIAPGVWLLPAPLAARATSLDPTAVMDGLATPAGALRIGLAHGSAKGFGSTGDASVPIDPERPRRAGLAYLALGDWHGCRQVGERAWYSGTPEPDDYLDNAPGHVLDVRLDGPRARPHVTPVATAAFRWIERRLALTGTAQIDAVQRQLEGAGVELKRLVVKLVGTGMVSLGDFAEIGDRLDRLEAAVFNLERDLSALHASADPRDLERFATEPGLREAVRRLQSVAETKAGAEADDARRALSILFAMARGGSA